VKFTLKDYQEDAVALVLANLERARGNFQREGQPQSVTLTAPTGAGKTVMAASAIEALFYGSEEFDFDPVQGAVVVWFSDSPDLNEQTRRRLMDASEKFTPSDLKVIEPPFSRPKLEPGKVYFLNTGKLTRNSLLTRGHLDDCDAQLRGPAEIATPDMQGWTIWQTIANTIEDDDLTLYLVLDEAHRGFNARTSGDKPTIVRRLVNGHAGLPPIPIVWGISATIQHFRDAMQAADVSKDRRALPAVSVDPARVQESGLVKDVVALSIPNEAGNFDTTLVRLAARKLRESSERWAVYSRQQGLTDTVRPLLVLQAPNTPSGNDIGRALDAIAGEYPEIRAANVRHVFGDHTSQQFGAWDVEWIEPQSVEETGRVRVLVAKDAISTGWDCPRAEVMVSFRPARDKTHITQLLGRMVRSPLAMRVPGDERLNSVECILPFFDRTTAGQVVKYLTGQLEELPGKDGKKILLDARELRPNPNVGESVWKAWDALPTQTLPKRGARAVKRLVALAHALAMDGLKPNALADAEAQMHLILDTFAHRYPDLLERAIDQVWRVDLQEIAGKVGAPGLTYREFAERADDRAIRSAFDDAKKAFGADVAQSYVNHLAGSDDDDGDDVLRDAFVKASALAMVKEIREKVDQEATAIVDRWFAESRVARKGLPDIRQQIYSDILAMAIEPQLSALGRPRTRMEGYQIEAIDGQLSAAPTAPLHLMSDDAGHFPLSSLNEWERKVVAAELGRKGIVGWYRNPPVSAVDSLSIAYRDRQGNWRSMHPDFIFFHEVNGEVRASIVDPHGHHLDDAAVKLRALAAFADRYGDAFYRIEAVTEIEHGMRVLDMTIPQVRDALKHGRQTPMEIYLSDLAVEYDVKPH
jgi:hypothetical protein